MKKRMLLGAFALIGLALSGCTNNVESEYKIKNIDIYRKNDKADKQIDLKFYKENPNVPYIGVKEFFKEFFKTDLTSNVDNSFYTFKKGETDYIKLDTKNELIEVKELEMLSKHPDFISSNNNFYLKLESKVETKKQYKTIDLKNYDILTYSFKDDACLPVTLLADLYGGIEGYYISYNGKALYVLDASGELSDGTSRLDEYYSNTYYSLLASNEERYSDLAKYNYNQLCLSFDNLRGYTNQLVFGDHNLETIGLDSLLQLYYPEIKKLLLSSNRTDYNKGIMLLFGGLYDGGHTGLKSKNPPEFSYYEEFRKNPKFKDLANKFLSIEEQKLLKRQNISDKKCIILGVDYSTNKFGYKFDSENKIAYIAFDRFVIDFKSWDSYYKGNKDVLIEMEKSTNECDTYAFVRKSLYKAKEDGALNVVFDFTSNGGGSLDAVMGVFGLINGAKAYSSSSNTVDKSRIINNYLVDINLDGKFDSLDIEEAKKFNFNIVGLTSQLAFSGGNYLPFLMKSKGFKMIGSNSGGGSCALMLEATADGFLYNRSGYSTLCDEFGNNVDSGVSVDKNINYMNNDSYDYSKYFDTKYVSDLIKSIK